MLSSRITTSFRRAAGKPHHRMIHRAAEILARESRSVPQPTKKSPAHSSSSSPSSSTDHQQQSKKQIIDQNKDATQGNPSMPAFSFKDLGMSRGVKIVVYTAVGILGTMETVFYSKVIWRWWKGEQDESVQP